MSSKLLTPQETLAEKAATFILQAAKENPQRSGLQRTPHRYARAMGTLLSGYDQTPNSVVGEGIFPSESRGVVSVNEIEFYSMCEHHMLPFWGVASVAYYPQDKIVGLSKIPRLVEMFSRRLQVQERLTEQVAEALIQLIAPRAVLVRIRAQHLCMMMRGVEKQHSYTNTEVLKGSDNLNTIELDRLFKAIGT